LTLRHKIKKGANGTQTTSDYGGVIVMKLRRMASGFVIVAAIFATRSCADGIRLIISSTVFHGLAEAGP
jgi:hypothetical protein